MEIIRFREYDEDLILPLYEEAGWTNYTDNPAMLRSAWMNSLASYGAWEDDELVGIIRVVGDGASIIYIQDLIVLPSSQRKGVGTRLVETIVDAYPSVYQMVLMTDDTDSSVSFYNALGFRRSDTIGTVTFLRIETPSPDAG